MQVGHEYVGEIVEIGQEVRGFQIGDRVSGEGHITCGHCRNCRAGRRHLCRNTVGVGVNREGAFAEYLVIPAFNAFKIPDDISDDLAAIFDPFGNATHTALSFNLVGEDVLITGAGPIGIMAAAIARHVGARHVVITDVNDYRLALARRMGATRAINIERENLRDVMADLGMTEGFDVGMEMSGVPDAFSTMLSHMNHGGKVALLAFLRRKWRSTGTRSSSRGWRSRASTAARCSRPGTRWSRCCRAASIFRRSSRITMRAERYEDAFATMLSGKSGKIVLDWSEAA